MRNKKDQGQWDSGTLMVLRKDRANSPKQRVTEIIRANLTIKLPKVPVKLVNCRREDRSRNVGTMVDES